MNNLQIKAILQAHKTLTKDGLKEDLIYYLRSHISEDKRMRRAQIGRLAEATKISYSNTYNYIFRDKSCSIDILINYVEIVFNNEGYLK